jgi:glycosyltransferase involved in cell wall biosynthesis
MNDGMRILFMAQTSAVHAARWVNQFADTTVDAHVAENWAPDFQICSSEFACGTFHVPIPMRAPRDRQAVGSLKDAFDVRVRVALRLRISEARMQTAHEEHIAHLITTWKPDIIHLLGLGVNWRNQGLPLLRVRELLGGRLPAPWVYSSWGTDLDFFGADSAEREGVCRVLGAVDYHISECERDRRLAAEMGFTGRFGGFFPAFGGVDLERLETYRRPGPVSARDTIVLKGRDCGGDDSDPVGRAMTVMRALGQVVGALRRFRIIIVQATPNVAREAVVLSAATGLDIRVMPRLSREDLLRVVGSARAVVAMTVNDGLPATLVEAMALGALPVHSDLEPVREWVVDGRNGLLVPPENVDTVAKALLRAVGDDDLVDSAARGNVRMVKARLDVGVVRRRAMGVYEQIAARQPITDGLNWDG